MTSGCSVAALVADLLFAARVRAAARAAGVSVAVVRSPDELLRTAREAALRLVLLELDERVGDPVELIRALKSDATTRAIPVVAFVSHVRTDLIEAARAAGAERVLARSAFVKELSGLLGSLSRP